MLNNTSVSRIDFKAAATGIMQKTIEGSFFINCHHNSKMADKIFSNTPKYDEKEVIVLQILIIHEGYLIIELLNK